jgi:sulfhydrogenase subunit gamma (sulfur reductase)
MVESQKESTVQSDKAFYVPRPARVVSVDRHEMHAVVELVMPRDEPLGHQPGQFVQVSVFGFGEAPISVCSPPTCDSSFQLCVRPVGNVSRAIHGLAVGDWIGIRGPYGKGHFPVNALRSRDALILAGGIGIAPLRSLIGYIRNRREDYGRLIIVYGSRTPETLLFNENLATWSDDPTVELYVTVDEPDAHWTGRTGVITEPLKTEIDFDPRNTIAVATGPPVMFKFVAMELFKKGMQADQVYFSLERRFHCGIGKCGHCQLNDLYVCQNGPVFCLEQLLQRPEAVEAWAPEADPRQDLNPAR